MTSSWITFLYGVLLFYVVWVFLQVPQLPSQVQNKCKKILNDFPRPLLLAGVGFSALCGKDIECV